MSRKPPEAELAARAASRAQYRAERADHKVAAAALRRDRKAGAPKAGKLPSL